MERCKARESALRLTTRLDTMLPAIRELCDGADASSVAAGALFPLRFAGASRTAPRGRLPSIPSRRLQKHSRVVWRLCARGTRPAGARTAWRFRVCL